MTSELTPRDCLARFAEAWAGHDGVDFWQFRDGKKACVSDARR